MSLKSLEEEIKRKAQREHKEKLLRRESEQKWQLKQQSAKAVEQSLSGEKLGLAREIFCWTEEFAGTAAYAKLARRVKDYPYMTDGIEIYGGGWGHELPRYDGFGCWSRVWLNPNGSIKYEAGYKWMGVMKSFTFDSPDGLAGLLSHDFLEKFAAGIKSEKIYDWIKQKYCGE